VELANNTPYGLAASVWTENINLALDVAPKIKAGVVWVNCTNLFDAASGFGGYRESGFGREGGKEGMWEYLKPETRKAEVGTRNKRSRPVPRSAFRVPRSQPLPPIDRTYKLFIGGAQVRPDQGYSRKILAPSGALLAEVAEGNRKDIRNAVEAAHAADGWAKTSGHNRGQVLYYLAENLAQRADEFAQRISGVTGHAVGDARAEVDASIARLFSYAAWADKYDGAVHQTPIRGVTLAMNEPVGVIGIACPEESPLLGFVSLVGPAVAVGNTVIAIPSEAHPLAATELYTVLDASDVPAGVINIVTGAKDALAKVLAEHDDVDAAWYFGSQAGGAEVERASAGNMKRTWVEWHPRDWNDSKQGEGREFLREATQVKNIWIPYGE
jgi:aldehyde dehydrogenase (NAD+)